MGSTLTNTQPKDTYKGILKTSDTTELSGTAKYVSDGNGNDSPLALSTSAVGIGTASPATKFVVSNAGAAGLEIEPTGLLQSYNRSTSTYQSITLDGANVLFRPSGTEVGRFTADGLTFNGDTAAANALDDYEEGTWTPAANGLTLNYTVTSSNGHYTKIGNVVTVSFDISWTSSNVGPASATFINNLPFTAKGAAGSYYGGSVGLITSTAAVDQFWVRADGYGTSLYVIQRNNGSASSDAPASIWGASNRLIASVTYLV